MCSTTYRQIGSAGRVRLNLYRGGHMFYIDQQERKAFSADAAAILSRQRMTPAPQSGGVKAWKLL